MKIRKITQLMFILILIGCQSKDIRQQEEDITNDRSSITTLPPSHAISPTSTDESVVITTTPYSRDIDKTNIEHLVPLRQWNVEGLSYAYNSSNFWFSDSTQFVMPMIGSPPLGGLQSFSIDDSFPMWFIQLPHDDFTINEHDQVVSNFKGLKIFNRQGEQIQAIQTNEQCDVYSPLSNYILTITGTSLVVTGQQDAYRDFGLYGNNTDKARILIWDTSNNICSNLIDQFDGIITSLSASHDGRYISYVVMEQTADPRIRTTRIFDLTLRKEKCELAGGLYARFTRQGQLVVYDAMDYSVSIVALDDCSVVGKFNSASEIIETFSLNPNGDLLAGVTGFSIVFLDLQTGEKLREIGIGEANLSIIGFSPNGRFLVTAKQVDDLLKKDQLILWGISE